MFAGLAGLVNATALAGLSRVNYTQRMVGELVDEYRRELATVAGITVTVLGIKYWLRVPANKDKLVTWYLYLQRSTDRLMDRHSMQVSLHGIRSNVRDGHPHKEAAEKRNGATQAMMDYVYACGLEPYVVSPSAREVAVAGVRNYYQLADVAQDPMDNKVTRRSVIVMTDVDYYVDMAYWMSFGVPILLYTFVPEAVGGEVDNGYFFIEDDYVVYHVNGGKTYRHQLWDYNQDYLYSEYHGWDLKGHLLWVVSRMLRSLGLADAVNASVFSVDQFRVGANRRIIAMVPVGRFPLAIGFDRMGKKLERMQITQDGFNTLTVIPEEGSPYVSVSRNGNMGTVQMPLAEFESQKIAYKLAQSHFLSDTERRARGVGSTAAVVLHDYLRSTSAVSDVVIQSPGRFAKHYQTLDGLKFEDGKMYARRYAPPAISDEAVHPVESENNDRACIAGRIDAPQKAAKENIRQIPQVRFSKYAREFVVRVVPDEFAATGLPLSNDEIYLIQDRPSQRARANRSDMEVGCDMRVLAFQKRESYGAVNHPRNISTVPTRHTMDLSGYTYSMKKSVLVKLPWYDPCKTPRDMAAGVMQYVSGRESVRITDYSRFDGTITQWLREKVEFAVYRRWVATDDLARLNSLLLAEVRAPARTRFGVKYDPGWSRLSGSPLTTDGNTLINGFVDYAAQREMGVSPDEAFQQIGPKYGDDGITGDAVTEHVLNRTAQFLGLRLKCETVMAGQPLTYLARVFVDPWTTPSSIQSPKRALQKIHVTTDAVTDIGVCGYTKTTAYLTTDGLTPMLSDWCRCYQRCAGENDLFVDKNVPFWYRDEEARNNSWPQQRAGSDVMGIIATELGITVGELEEHVKLLRSYSGPVCGMPVLRIPQTPVKLSCSMDGEIYTVEGEPTLHDVVEDSSRNSRKDGSTKPGGGRAGEENGGSSPVEGTGGSASKNSCPPSERCGRQGSQTGSKSPAGRRFNRNSAGQRPKGHNGVPASTAARKGPHQRRAYGGGRGASQAPRPHGRTPSKETS